MGSVSGSVALSVSETDPPAVTEKLSSDATGGLFGGSARMIATFACPFAVVVPHDHRHLTAVVDGLAHDAHAVTVPRDPGMKGVARLEDDVCFGIRPVNTPSTPDGRKAENATLPAALIALRRR